jgi:hypothetical protein
MKQVIIIVFFTFNSIWGLCQNQNNIWLLGNDSGWPNLGRFIFGPTSYQLVDEQRKMTFKGTQANISDNNGNLLMSSNGVWIANANGDTMMNGAGLNPGYFVNSWPYGLLIPNGNVFLPFPEDTNLMLLIHQTELDDDNFMGVYQTILDINLDNGLGAVIQKNDSLLVDTLGWGLTAVRHANGQNWWVVLMEDGNDSAYTISYSVSGKDSIFKQALNYTPFPHGNVTQLTFSQDGTKFITTTYDNPIDRNSSVVLADFDRCSGLFSNTVVIPVSFGGYLWGLAFSPSGQFVYTCTSNHVFQINTTTYTVDTVATYDGFISGLPPSCCATTFFNMYLAANGKIYITSGSSTMHIHEMNYPDSTGIACDIQQHSIALNNYFHLRSVPNHPNYYLGCDTTLGCPCLTTGIEEHGSHEFRFNVAPNPTNGSFKITYLLPQNQPGKLEVFDINCRRIYEMNLPHWSTMQNISVPNLADGMYNAVITSAAERVSKKVIILKE